MSTPASYVFNGEVGSLLILGVDISSFFNSLIESLTELSWLEAAIGSLIGSFNLI